MIDFVDEVVCRVQVSVSVASEKFVWSFPVVEVQVQMERFAVASGLDKRASSFVVSDLPHLPLSSSLLSSDKLQTLISFFDLG